MLHNKKFIFAAVVCLVLLATLQTPVFAAGHSASAAKTLNMSIAYGCTTLLSLALAGGYCALIKQKNLWLLLLHASVIIVNLGYFALSISKTLEEALLANRISYLGSVFLPLCMLMAIMDVCRVRRAKWIPGLLILVSVAVFILAASPGYSNLYYKDVTLVFINGMAKLDKVYGPLHNVYPVYLIGYFALMIGTILNSIRKKRVTSYKVSVILLTVVFLNIAIWLVEQLVYHEFEFLAVSYIVSELLMLMLYGLIQDYGILSAEVFPVTAPKTLTGVESEQESERIPAEASLLNDPNSETEPAQEELSEERIANIVQTWTVDYVLTGRESDVLHAILQDKKRKDIAAELCVTEHTVKKHTSNIFSKLVVSSRSELFAKAETEIP